MYQSSALLSLVRDARHAGLDLDACSRSPVWLDSGVYHAYARCPQLVGSLRRSSAKLTGVLTSLCERCVDQLSLGFGRVSALADTVWPALDVARRLEAASSVTELMDAHECLDQAQHRRGALWPFLFGPDTVARAWADALPALWCDRVRALDESVLRSYASELLLPMVEVAGSASILRPVHRAIRQARLDLAQDPRHVLVHVGRTSANPERVLSEFYRVSNSDGLAHMPMVVFNVFKRASISRLDSVQLPTKVSPDLLEAVSVLFDPGAGSYKKLSTTLRAARLL